MEAFYEVQKLLQKQISSSYSNFKKKGAQKMTKAGAQTRLNGLEEWYQQFVANHKKILMSKDVAPDHEYFAHNIFDEVVDSYYDKKGEFVQFLDDLRKQDQERNPNETLVPTNPNPVRQSMSVDPYSLPKMNLPKFTGSFSEWENFRDLFRSMVHRRNDLDNSMKYYYLRTHVSGEGLEHIKSISITSENYEKAWKTLVDHYDNKRRAITKLIKKMFSVKPMKSESVNELKRVATEIFSPFDSLKSLGRTEAEICIDLIIHLVVQQFENGTKKDWKKSIDTKDDTPPTLEQLKEFIGSQLETLESFEENDENPKSKTAKTKQAKENETATAHSLQTSAKQSSCKSVKCVICGADHTTARCEQFQKKTVIERRELAREKRLCYNCLAPSHGKGKCKSRFSCYTCKARHHTLLHLDAGGNGPSSDNGFSPSQDAQRSSPNNSPAINVSSNVATGTVHSAQANGTLAQVLLATAMVQVIGPRNKRYTVKALIDPCSQVSIVTQNLCNQLALSSSNTHVCIKGVGENSSTVASKLAHLSITTHFNSDFRLDVEALVLPKLSSYVPPAVKNSAGFEHIRGLQLADPEYASRCRIDLLLGARIYAQIIEGKIVKGTDLQPIAISSKLGWLLTGNVPTATTNVTANSNNLELTVLHCSCPNTGNDELHTLLQEFWRAEEIIGKNSCSVEEQKCEELFASTTFREQSGRYVVRLPWKDPQKSRQIKIGNSYFQALSALKRLEMNFVKDERLKTEYSKFMKDYLELGHMSLCKTGIPSADSDYFFLPHHGVWKEESTTTKLRTVFNGSARLKTGESLNDLLFSGPNLLRLPVDLISHVRNYKIALSADVEKMYRQIGVNEQDRKFQTILWRFNPQDQIAAYVLNTVTYGLTCSSYLAFRTLIQMAGDHEKKHPIAANVVREEMYSDNVLSGAHTSNEAKEKVQDLIALFQKARMNLRKWTSNDPRALSNLSRDMLVVDEVTLFASDTSIPMLGIAWHTKDDFFKFHIESTVVDKTITKRSVLSRIARIFDPLGWMAPVTVQAKILMQALWLIKVDWDEQLPEEVRKRWSHWIGELPSISKIEIPRWTGFTPQTQGIELHGFADASKLAYGAVLFLRLIEEDTVLVTLQVAKSKIAPLKTLSIPRLELCAALLLVRLAKQFLDSTKLSVHDVHLWTDSTDVLFWLKDHPARWNVFIANRCSEIHTSLPNAFWHHVRSRDNPADLVSRGVDPSKLQSLDLWWKGPEFLSSSKGRWSKAQNNLNFSVNSLSALNYDRVVCVNSVSNAKEKPNIWPLIDKYSSLDKLLRVAAYVIRFISYVCLKISSKRNKQFKILRLEYFSNSYDYQDASVSSAELENSKLLCCYLVQTAYFAGEYSLLSSGKKLSAKNSLANLNPFIKSHLIRVGGRLEHSLTGDDAKHPIILPHSSSLTSLFIRRAHLRALHGGTQLTLATLRQEVWIVRGRTEVRRMIKSCVQCVRYAAQAPSQMMGDLPESRVRPSRPFQKSGVDYAGPISVRLTKTRGKGTLKGYVCIFICLATRAIHLELVEDYTSDAFIAAFHRFTARRGQCKELRSDQRTTFVGADVQLRQMLSEASTFFRSVSHSLADLGTQWKFNPPSAPHFGGLWEAAVKSLKHHMRRVIGEQVLTFSELATLLCRIEACLNSRPLVAMSDDPSDLQFLTPAHFLIQEASYLVPETDLREEKIPIGKRWKLISQMVQHFWTRWYEEYLTTLQSRKKWLHPKKSPRIGDIVLIRNELYPPGKWPLGQIVDLHPGDDGLVRVVTIKTSSGYLRRPLVKVILLPAREDYLE